MPDPIWYRRKQVHPVKEVSEKQLISANPQLELINDQIIIETPVKNASVADAIYIAQRSLQGKSQKENSTFRTIFNDLRKELAQKYFQNSNMKLIDATFNLQFGGYSSFSRTFKHWTGLAPGAYRKQQQGPHPMPVVKALINKTCKKDTLYSRCADGAS